MMAVVPNARHEKVKYGYAALAKNNAMSDGQVTVVPNYVGKYN